MARTIAALTAVGCVFFLSAASMAQSDRVDCEIGGPLAGLRLPPFPTQHGEQPGYPGCIPELIAQGKPAVDMGNEYREWGPQGQAPERQLYEGSVEHWRAYMFKYMPVRSFFDRQSQIKNFVAAVLPDVGPSDVEPYAEPVYWVPRHQQPRPTDRFHGPVTVVRMKVDAPVLRLDLGERDIGLYVVRVIGAVETSRLRPFREPLFMRMTVNDQLDGGKSRYRQRLGYCDEFYSVAEFYFHAPRQRRYQAELAVDVGSTVDLLVHNVSLDDALAGCVRRAIKKRSTLSAATPSVAEPPTNSGRKMKRLVRDAAIWEGFPPPNTQGSGIEVEHKGYGSIQGVTAGTDRLSGHEIVARYGEWLAPVKASDLNWIGDRRAEDIFLVNAKLKLVHTLDDLRRGRPLPDPYPLKDDGAGLYYPDPNDVDCGAAWTPIGAHVHATYRRYYQDVVAKLEGFRRHGEYDNAHDAAVTLVRWAYAFPTLDYSRYLSNTVHDAGPYNRDFACRRRATAANFLPHYQMYVDPIIYAYDGLFDFIRGNPAIAESVGRFVPWVKTPEDVIRLIDVYLVQTTAKRILRYHYHTDPMDIANLAAVVGDCEVTDPWMEWLFARTFIYPLPVAGIQDVMTSGTTREGTEVVGSTYYAQGEGAARIAGSLEQYLAAGGNAKFDLTDPKRFPKPVAHANWRIENVVAGADFLRIGDVCGPDKVPGHTLRDLQFARNGWRWTRDPRFAFIVRHYLPREGESDAEWAEIERAAGKQPRAPWLELPSRVLPMWAGVLETGHQHDDCRFRRAAYVRLGFGMGHHHDDSLDLQVVAHGLPMTIDGGQRPGYTTPGDRTTRAHNLVQIDGHTAFRHSWATALADASGARYLAAEADPPQEVSLVRRQIALVDVDEGSGSKKLPPEKQKPPAELPREVTTPNSYVFDVFRAGGGTGHTYCFHGPLNDALSWNAADVGPPAPDSDEAEYLSRFSRMPERNLVGNAPEIFQATWRMAREVERVGAGEKKMLGHNFEPDSPRKFTRLHLLGVHGARVMQGEIVCQQWNYHFTNLMVRREGNPLDAAFVALVEPYAGEPFIVSRRELEVVDNEQDARRAVAVEVVLPGGRRDVCFADGRPERERTIPELDLKLSGEFAFYSIDEQGLRQVTLVGGRHLESPLVRLQTSMAERRGEVVRVDYTSRKMWLDATWPPRTNPSVLEVGRPGHFTSYTAVSTRPLAQEKGTAITLARGGNYFRSRITRIDPQSATVTTVLRPLIEHLDHNRTGWVASDDQGTTFWRATYLGRNQFRLEGPAVSGESFGDSPVLRLWEFGVGDGVRQSTSASLRRVGPGEFELDADVGVVTSLPGRSAELIKDSPRRVPVDAQRRGNWIKLTVPPAQPPLRLKIKP